MSKQNRLTAENADRHDLYQESVQDCDDTIALIDRIYERRHRRPPLTLREDFCGTALLCSEWARRRADRFATGIDIDAPTLAWGRRHNLEPLGEASARVRLLERDVREGTPGDEFDVIAALNFSYFTFHHRETLLDYFRAARRDLSDGGMLLLDLHGGPDAQFQLEEETEFDGFTYVWEQEMFDPINNRATSRIHYRFPRGGGELRDAFVYDWRVWSIPELRDALADAGFSGSDVWWEGEHDDEPHLADSAENLEAWVAYIAAWR
ncbi:MAG: methyltransferase domain-containing protein [Polyangia bacterium]